jgi:hypothetical protein
LIFACLASIGCWSSGPFDYVKVSGDIAYEDGTPLPGGYRLTFVAQEAPKVEGAFPRPAEALVDGQGKFEAVTSHKFGDGLIPGKHKVVIQPDRSSAKPVVPAEYTSSETTPLVVDTADRPLKIRVPKP